MRNVIISVIFVFFCFEVFSVQPLVRNFTRYDYKSGTQNWAIAQDSSNGMYFANNSGLLTFDGKNWITYPIVNRTSVHSILFAKTGRIFASTFNEFGYFEKLENGSYRYESILHRFNFKINGSNEIYNIVDGKRVVFFQSQNAIFKYYGDTLVKLNFNEKTETSAFIHNVYFVTSSQKGAFMLNGDMFMKIPDSEVLINKRVCAILPHKNNEVLFVTSFDGVFLYDGTTIRQYNTGIDEFLKKNQVFCATTDGKNIVFGTVQRGIAMLNIEDNTVVYVNTFTGLQNNTVLSAKFDKQNNLWLGLDKGIDYVLLNNPISNLAGANNLYGTGYTSIKKNQNMYFGTNQGLYFTSSPLNIQSLPLKLELIKGMEGQVWSLTEIDKQIFCGDDKGAYIVNDNNIEKISGLNGTWTFKKVKNRPDLIIGCSYKGLFVLRKSDNKWIFSHFLKGNFNESSPMFEQYDDSTVWFSHWQKGLFRLTLNTSFDSITRVVLYNESKGFPSNRNNTVFRVNNQLIFSSEYGLYSYNPKTDKMEPAQRWNKLFGSLPSYMRLHESPTGDVWCVSGSFFGLARKEKDFYTMDSLTYRIIQPKIIAGFEHFQFIDSKNLILNTEDGFSLLKIQPESNRESNFKLFIENIKLTSKSGNGKNVIFAKPGSDNSFENRFNNIRFEFVAPEYRADGLVTYSCMLENYDNDWSAYSSENIKEYNHLPAGKYIFRIKSRNLLESKISTFDYSFTILPAWYETKLAFALYFILCVLALIYLVRYINFRSKQGAQKMKELKEREIEEQKLIFDEERTAKKREIKELKNQQLQYELRHKSQELASSTMNLIRKNEILLEIVDTLNKTAEDIRKNTEPNTIIGRLNKVEKNIRENIQGDDNWKKFEENFDLVYENYLKRLGDAYPDLNITDKKICAYIKMDLSSKDMAPLLNMTVRSIETNRYRIRQKLGLDRENNLSDFLQKF